MSTVALFVVGDGQDDQINHLKRENKNLAFIGLRSSKLKQPPPADNPEFRERYIRVRMHLQWMDSSLEMTPEINQKTGTERILERVAADPAWHFPADIKERAGDLHARWASEGWGASTVADADEEDIIKVKREESRSLSSMSPSPMSAVNATPIPPSPAVDETLIAETTLPQPDHPIFGVGSIMHGVIMARGPKMRIYRLNPNIPKKPAKVYGHNGIPVGAWFPLQIVALHRGAHGQRMGGISGSTDTGAYSIVVSLGYEDLDEDRGDILYYSGSNSHNNEDPMMPAASSNGTNALKASVRSGLPVRVLRAGGSGTNNRYAPECGIRYDGLYRVMKLRERKNSKGGLFEQFQLIRDSGQTPLEKLCRTSPTAKEKFDLNEIQRGY